MSYHKQAVALERNGLGDPGADDGARWEYSLKDLDREAAAMDAAREEKLTKEQREEDDNT